MKTLVTLIAAASLAAPLSARAQEEKEHAKARLICESKTLTPGKTAWFALHFEIDAHWHLYWNGVNDSGFAPKLNAAFPPGFTVGEMLWPAPKRLILPGDILDHIYENRVSLLFPVAVPADAKPGTVVEFKASPEWLVCHEVCLPGSAELRLSVAVGTPEQANESGPDAVHFAKARQRIPKALPKEKSPVTLRVADGKLLIQASGAMEVAFYPGLEGVAFPSILKEGQRKGEQLVLSFQAGENGSLKARGVIEVKPREGEQPTLWAVDVDLETLNKKAPGPSDTGTRYRGD